MIKFNIYTLAHAQENGPDHFKMASLIKLVFYLKLQDLQIGGPPNNISCIYSFIMHHMITYTLMKKYVTHIYLITMSIQNHNI